MSTEYVSRPFADALVAYAETNDRVVCVTNDLTKSVEADAFRSRFPDRYFSLGMAEQNLVGVLSGLAREGLEPFYPSFSVFVTRRPYEQILLNVAYPNLPVRLIGFLPGLTTPGGVTHQATDDVALMGSLPNMTVLSLADATDVETFTDTLGACPGPVFARMPRGDVPRLFESPFSLGRCRVLSSGNDVTLISTGPSTADAIEAVARLQSLGIGVDHLNVSTLKPFSDPAIIESISRTRKVITAENHLVRGGLGTVTSELITDAGIPAALRRVGVRDTFTHGGRASYLATYYGIDTNAILESVDDLLGTSSSRPGNVAHQRPTTLNTDVAEGL